MILDENMSANKETNLSLRIASKDLNCEDISRILDWQPTKQFNKGEPIYKKNPKHLRDACLWIYELKSKKKILFEEHISSLIELISKKKNNLGSLKDCSIDVFCGYTTYNGQGGFILESKLMRELSYLGIDFIIEFYNLEKDERCDT